MSVTEDLVAVVASANSLLNEFNDFKDGADDALEEARSSVVDMEQTFYVDQVNGDDSAAGASDTPLKSINEAVSRTSVSGICNVFLLSDYLVNENISLRAKSLSIAGSGAKRELSFTPYVLTEDSLEYRALYGFDFFGFCRLDMNNVSFVVPSITGYDTYLVHPRSSPLRCPNTGSTGLHTFAFRYSDMDIPEDKFSSVWYVNGLGALRWTSITMLDQSYRGNLVYGVTVAEGTDTTTLSWLVTNVTLL